MATSAETRRPRLRRRPAVARRGGSGSRSGCSSRPRSRSTSSFVIVPVVQAVHYSFYSWTGLGPLTDFIGLHNYREAFGDRAFRQAMTHNAILAALSLALQLPLALGVALASQPADARPQCSSGSIFFAPYVLSEAVTAIALPADPPAGRSRRRDAEGGRARVVSSSSGWPTSRLVFYTLFVVITWKYIGFAIILLPGGPAGRSQPSCTRRPRSTAPVELGDVALRHAAAARPDDPHLDLPLRHRLDPALRPRLDHDRSAAPPARRRRWPPTWSTRASTATASATRRRSR